MTLIEGDGIGPEISRAVVKIFEAAKVRSVCIRQLMDLYWCVGSRDMGTCECGSCEDSGWSDHGA